ncbi:MAG: MM0924 family protein [Candidatus Hermodarchaeota archaeon]
MKAKFISEHFINEKVDVYCGSVNSFKGKVLYCADNVLTLESEDKTMTFISIPKIIALWKAKE